MEGQLNRGISIRREPCEAGEEPAGPQSVSLGTWFGSIRVAAHLHTWSSGLAVGPRHGSVSQQTVSFPATSSMRHTDASTPTRPSVPGGQVEKAALRLASAASAQAIAAPQAPGEHLPQHPVAQPAVPSQHAVMPVYHFPTQLGMMHQLKEQLEERTRILQADIKTQQEELHVIKEQLQLVQDSNLQMLMQPPIPVVFNNVQHPSPRRPPGTPRQTTAKKSQQQGLMGTKHFCSTRLPSPCQFLRDPCSTAAQVQQQQHLMRGNQAQQACLPGQTSISVPLYNNPVVFSQTCPVTVAAQMPTEGSERQPQSDYSQDRSLRFVAEQQILPSPIQMQPITCSTVRPPAPSPVFSPSLMIPHTSFTSHQANTPVHLHQWPQQQVQQHRLYLQMQAPEPGPGGPTQRIFQPPHTPQQNPLSYFLQPQPQSRHAQGQACNLPDLPEMQLP